MRRSRSVGDSLNKLRLKRNGKTTMACSNSDEAQQLESDLAPTEFVKNNSSEKRYE
jgi:hypothetical protein